MSIIRQLLLVCAAIPILAGAPPAIAKTDWPATRFKVCFADPDSYLIEYRPGLCDGDPALAEQIEWYMGEVGADLRKKGFRAPRLGEPVATPDGPAYRIFVFDAPDEDTQAAHNNPCSGAEPYIYLDLERDDESAVFEGSQITPKGYADIAHELFHAIQASYPPFVEACKIGEWIREGSAQVWGKDTARRLKGVPRDDLKRPSVMYKARGYDSSLYVGPSTREAYRTGSFWRFLGEEHAARQNGGRGTIAEREPDYGYLSTVFEQPFADVPNEAVEYIWIDRGLTQAFGRGLGSYYPEFVGQFAAFVPGREAEYISRREGIREQAQWS